MRSEIAQNALDDQATSKEGLWYSLLRFLLIDTTYLRKPVLLNDSYKNVKKVY